MGAIIRAMSADDVGAVMALERTLFCAGAWSRSMLEDELQDAESRWYIVAADGSQVLAYAGLAQLGDEAHVMTIGTDPDHQGRGLGRMLLRALIAEATKRAVRQTVLEVRIDAPVAISLYESEGFEQVAVRRGYYQPDNVDAVVMIRVH